MKYEVHTTEIFDKWARSLRDRAAARAIAMRIARVRVGNLGDVAPVGDGVSEMRIFVGKGYRLYYVIRETTLVLLLCGGNKGTQKRDIIQAKVLARLN